MTLLMAYLNFDCYYQNRPSIGLSAYLFSEYYKHSHVLLLSQLSVCKPDESSTVPIDNVWLWVKSDVYL